MNHVLTDFLQTVGWPEATRQYSFLPHILVHLVHCCITKFPSLACRIHQAEGAVLSLVALSHVLDTDLVHMQSAYNAALVAAFYPQSIIPIVITQNASLQAPWPNQTCVGRLHPSCFQGPHV